MTRSLISALILTALCSIQHARCQLSSSPQNQTTSAWDNRRVVALKGFGDYYVQTKNGEFKLIRPDGLSVDIVAVVQIVDGDRIWIKANGTEMYLLAGS